MAPGGEGGGAGDGGGNDDAAAALRSNGGGGSTNGNAAAAPVPSCAAAAAPPPQRALGGFKIKVKLPPRGPSGDGGASVAGDGMASDANAATASLKRPAEGQDVGGGAAGPPQKLKITLKGIKIGGGLPIKTTPQGPAPLSSPGSVATSPVAAAGGAPGSNSSSKPKRVRSAKPPPASFPASAVAFAAAAAPAAAAPIYGGGDGGFAGADSDAAVPWADEVEEEVAAAPAPVVARPPPPPPTTTAKATTQGPSAAAASLPFIPAQPPKRASEAEEREGEDEEGRRRASRTEASPGPSSTAAAAAAAAGRGGRRGKPSRRAPRGGSEGRSDGGVLDGGAAAEKGDERLDERGNDADDSELFLLPRLHPTRSATRDPVIRISDAVDPTVPDVPLERNQAVALIEKVAKRDREGVFREVPSDYVAPGYSKLIARPVAFSTIRARAAAGGYRREPPEHGWDELCDDLDTMLDNCRAYNGPDSPWGLYADAFQLAAARMLQLSRAGVTDLRGKTGNLSALKQGAGGGDGGSGDEAGPAGGGVGRYFRDASYTGGGGGEGRGGEGGRGGGAATAAAPSVFGSRVRTMGRGGGGLLRSLRADAEAARDGLPRRLDDDGNWLEWRFTNKRSSYPARIGGVGGAAATSTVENGQSVTSEGIAAAAGGLARGHNGDGHALLGTLALLPSYVGAPPSDAYARSVARFAAGLKGRARERALAAAAASLPVGGGGGRQQSVRPSPLQVSGGAPPPPLPMPMA